MPKEIKDHQAVLEAIGSVDIISDLIERHDGHFRHELDLEVIAYGRTYNGKKVGPYIHLYEFDSGEELIREGDWGGNTFYITVEGSLDVFVRDKETGHPKKLDELKPGTSFGIMSVLAGMPRTATIAVPPNSKVRILEIQRPALRLLRKLPKFGHLLDQTYRKHGLVRTLAEVQQTIGGRLDPELLTELGRAASFMVYGRHHVLLHQGDPIERVVFIKSGWVRRVRGLNHNSGLATIDAAPIELDKSMMVDFLGAGHCLGLEGIAADARWGYSITVLQRAEVLEISIEHVRANDRVREVLERDFATFSADDGPAVQMPPEGRALTLTATEKEIETGVIDATNVLVMDMDRCVRCGNCSLACHKVHGQSRLMRRGVQIERPRKISSPAAQQVLLPSVCIHCHDPECLTGCPTGAIGRFMGGQVDIDLKTCIGCGDCAVQCPYNAISMIPRGRPKKTPLSWGARVIRLLTLSPPPPPRPVTEVEDLIAVMCNLCAGTALNPPSAKRPAYSCQENCPTGALVRINPLEYFTEAKTRINLAYRDRTHAVGRNIHIRDSAARLGHVLGVAATAAWAALALYALFKYGLDREIGGTGMTLRRVAGLVGLAGTVAVMAYPVRKQVYRRRAGPLRYWLLAHVYAGVIAVFSFLLHGGGAARSLLTSVLTASLDVVIATGLFGVACYAVCPRILTSIEDEPLLIEELRQRREELRKTLADIGQRSDDSLREFIRRKVRGHVFSYTYLLRQYLKRERLAELLASARETYKDEARDLDSESRKLLLEAVEATVTLRRVDSLIYLHQLLKLWLAPHILASLLMLALMLAHIVQVTFFATR